MITNTVTEAKLDKYFDVSKRALAMAHGAEQDEQRTKEAKQALDMAQRYYDDAKHFKETGEHVTAFAALNYAHGWLDCIASFGIIKVHDDTLFTVDSKPVVTDK